MTKACLVAIIAHIQQNHYKTKEMFRSKRVFELTAYLKFTRLQFPLSLLSDQYRVTGKYVVVFSLVYFLLPKDLIQ